MLNVDNFLGDPDGPDEPVADGKDENKYCKLYSFNRRQANQISNIFFF